MNADRIEGAVADTLPTEPTETAAEPTNALAVPEFRAFWFNGVTFFLAANALRFVYGWVVLDGLGRGEAAQGFIVFLLGLPTIFLVLPAGVWADRFDPKRLLLFSQLALLVTLAVTALAVGDGAGTFGLLIASALVAGSVSAVGGPVRQSLVPTLLPPSLLYSGIALNALAMTMSLVGGAVLARFFGDRYGFDGAFWWMVVLLALGVGALQLMASPGPATRGDVTTMRQAIGEGFSFVWHNPAIRTLFFLLSLSGLVLSPVMFVTIQAHIKTELGRSAGDAAPVLALMGLGIAVSSVFIMRRGSMPNKGAKFMRAMIGGTSTIAVMGFTNAYWQMLVLGLIMGMCGGFFINMNQGLIQANTPKAVMGRVMGLYTLVQLGFTPFGAVVLGIIAEAVGTGPTMTGAGLVGLGCVIVTYLRAKSLHALT